jgi:hypothetical protein
MIASMARWMGFIGMFVLIVSAIGIFFILLGVSFFALILGSDNALLTEMGKFGVFLRENQWALSALAAAMLLLNILQVAAGYYLYWASRAFNDVARTNEADQDFLALGLTQLKTAAKISTTVAVFQLLVNVAAGFALTGLENLTN